MASRRGVVRALLGGAAGALVPVRAGLAATPRGTAKVPMAVGYESTWLSWVAAVTGCLKALGQAVDVTDVSGLSGYAFITNVHPKLQASGPTAFRRSMLNDCVPFLGRSLRIFEGGVSHTEADTSAESVQHCRDAFDMVSEEISAGRPCVVWGPFLPEYAIVAGVQDGAYLVKSYRRYTNEPEPPVPLDQLDAPGSVYVLAFPSPTRRPQAAADRFAIDNAAWILSQPSFNGEHVMGTEAYDTWLARLEKGDADPFGHSYCAACYADARRHATEFLRRVAGRAAEPAEALTRASDAYARAQAALAKLSELFPHPPGKEMDDDARRTQGVALLKTAREAETDAVSALRQAQAMPWKVG